MTPVEWVVLLLLAALCLWLTIFLFTLLDHFIYRGTYGHFLMGLDAIEREAGASTVGVEAMGRHMAAARTRYLARYLSHAGSSRGPARIAAAEYIGRMGAAALMMRAAEPRRRRRARQVAALYALSRTGHPGVLPLLEATLASKQPVLAYAALDMLDIHGSHGAAEVLLRALEGGVLPASRIATHLEHFRIDLTDLYVARLERRDPKARYWIAYLLGRAESGGRAVEILEDLLDDGAADVRKIALASLAMLHAPRLQGHAERMLEDPVFFVRTQAARILAGFGNPSAVRALARRLSDEHDAVQLAVQRSLVELGPVTLEHLDMDTVAPGSPGAARIAEISSTIRHARAIGDAPAQDAKTNGVARAH